MTTGGGRLNLEAVRALLACVAAMLQCCWQVGRICGAGAGRAALTAFGLSRRLGEGEHCSADISKCPGARAVFRSSSLCSRERRHPVEFAVRWWSMATVVGQEVRRQRAGTPPLPKPSKLDANKLFIAAVLVTSSALDFRPGGALAPRHQARPAPSLGAG